MKIELRDMRRTGKAANGYNFVGVVSMAVCPRIGETVHLDCDDAGFTVKAVLHIVGGKPPQVRGW